MNFRKHLALPAAFFFAALALTGCQQGTHAAEATAKAASPAVSPAVAAVPAGASAAAVKSIHSPGIVATDEQLAVGQCSAKVVDAATGEYLPDPACTPGAADPAVTPENIDSTICTSGYTATVRPPASDTDKVKAESLREYGQTAMKTTEYDHLISLELGGTNSVSNLWPEPNKAGATGTTNPKDAVENTLHKAVCTHKVTLSAAQQAIAHNWVTAIRDLGL
ncbi:hypothetical protein [Arthrobacter sp. B2a2-09]|uniref:hypothetical protein n=1 Tax=Arthrobacter sp. B2a2-09 TaxID=2952822 RepID=UPI0022CD6866|nr:hypothetical protein [Arthrobacter sp. B2a2-09]MCZ9882729.1 hypothetical protein [Arthrobacter sp. B2a2-09]